MRLTVIENGGTRGSGAIEGRALRSLARELGVEDRLPAWRDRGLLPHPTRDGYEGRRPLWFYPAHTADQLRAAVRWRSKSRDLESIKVALWAEGFPIPPADVREAIVHVVDLLQQVLQ